MLRGRLAVFLQNTAYDILVDLDAEGIRSDLGNPGAAEFGIALLNRHYGIDQYPLRSSGSWLAFSGATEQAEIFSTDQCMMELQDR